MFQSTALHALAALQAGRMGRSTSNAFAQAAARLHGQVNGALSCVIA
jgi:hypothetical protein